MADLCPSFSSVLPCGRKCWFSPFFLASESLLYFCDRIKKSPCHQTLGHLSVKPQDTAGALCWEGLCSSPPIISSALGIPQPLPLHAVSALNNFFPSIWARWRHVLCGENCNMRQEPRLAEQPQHCCSFVLSHTRSPPSLSKNGRTEIWREINCKGYWRNCELV